MRGFARTVMRLADRQLVHVDDLRSRDRSKMRHFGRDVSLSDDTLKGVVDLVGVGAWAKQCAVPVVENVLVIERVFRRQIHFAKTLERFDPARPVRLDFHVSNLDCVWFERLYAAALQAYEGHLRDEGRRKKTAERLNRQRSERRNHGTGT